MRAHLGNRDPNEGALIFAHSSISRILQGVEINPFAGFKETQKGKLSASASDVIVSHSTAMTFSGQGTGMQMRAPSFFPLFFSHFHISDSTRSWKKSFGRHLGNPKKV